MIRFIHSSDLHLGKRFGHLGGDLPGRLREARHGVLSRLAGHARDTGAETILLAGDTFDTETPAPDIRRQALVEMARHAPIRWVILPGNHDSLQASQLWASLKAEAPPNVILAVEARPIELGGRAVLLPAPCTTRRPGRDLTEWMDAAATPEGTLRIGLAHGPIQSFSEEGSGADILAPDRARRAGLDYLALGDWHGAMTVDPRTRYSGAPEPDRFKHDRPGEALLIRLDAPGALPEAASLPTASFSWRVLELHLMNGEDAVGTLASRLPPPDARRQTLVQLSVTGTVRLADRTALLEAVAHAVPEFAHLALDAEGLISECEVEDLDRIDRAGALREAADALLRRSEDAGLAGSEREIARAALARLYALSQTVAA
ncbi:DNA repair exonuclease [Aureimonas sp. ME7]|uniref:metallophosphoesterase family protein n=1 Tax=Aureimonas sp. ME7 TaxID=2744252 RepID=UPI0015F4CA72|nr:DNA repair exonuclease [Aureimonas sp. ME7]